MKNRIQRIEKKLRKRSQIDNHDPIYIRDVVAYQVSSNIFCKTTPMGEYKTICISSDKFDRKKVESESEDEFIIRVVDYIVNLADHAEEIHVKDNFLNPDKYISSREIFDKAREHIMLQKQPEISHINPSKLNNITRLSLNEFALYPNAKRGPLSLKGFKKLTNKISEVASVYPENFHLMAATIPVKITENQVQNMAIYAECGKSPRLYTFTKAVPSHMDPVYSNTQNPQYSADKNQPIPEISSLTNDINIQYGGNLICHTAGGKPFRVAADICLDQYEGIALRRVMTEIERAEQQIGPILPHDAEHLIVSNFIPLTPEKFISETVTQVDTKNSPNGLSQPIYNGFIEPEVAREITNPIFGSTTNVDIFPSRKMTSYHPQLKKNVNAINEFNIKLDALKKDRSLHLADKDILNEKISHHILTPVITALTKANQYQSYVKQLESCEIGREKQIKILAEMLNRIKVNRDPTFERSVSNALSLLKQDMVESNSLPSVKLNSQTKVQKIHSPSFNNNQPKSVNFFKNPNALPDSDTQTKTIYHATERENHSRSNWCRSELPSSYSSYATMFKGYLSVLQNQVVFEYVQYIGKHYLFKFLPWNKESPLSRGERVLLQQNLLTLNNLEKEFNIQKQRRAYRFGVNADKYEDVATRIEHSREGINTVLQRKTKTSAELYTIKTHLEEIVKLLPQLTNKEIEKELRYEEIHLARQQRRSRF